MTTKEKIDELLYQNGDDFKMAKILKTDIAEYFKTLEETFATSGGKDFFLRHTRKIDSIIKLIYKIALHSMFKHYQPMKNSLPVTLVALGSYGREQLCVYSDIDLLIVYKDVPGYNAKEIIEKILYLIWDSGMKLGHRVHNVEELLEVSRTDITIKTALIESRFLEGSRYLWVETQNAIDSIRHDDPQEYIRQKLHEQQLMHIRNPLTMEPNLKEGEGGFRDANLVYWIGKVHYNVDRIRDLPEHIVKPEDYRDFRIALEFLFRVRSALHLAAGKKVDQLRLELIPAVAQYLGYHANTTAHMRFARKVQENLTIIRFYSLIWLDTLCREYGIIPLQSDKKILSEPSEETNTLLGFIKYLNREANEEFVVSHPLLYRIKNASKPKRLSQGYYAQIRDIFRQPHAHSILRTLWDAHRLGFLMTILRKVINLPQFDGYHQYSVDTHLLQTLYTLEHIDSPFIAELYETLSPKDKELLKLVAFLHDAGKGRQKDHSLVGAALFRLYAKQLGYDENAIDNGVALITYHTLMSSTAQTEDLYNEKVILKFASRFQTKRMLDLIYILTYADMSAVNKGVYNTFNARLLHNLYTSALESLEHGEILDETARRIKKENSLRKLESFNTLPKSAQKKILSIPSNLLFLRYRPEQILNISHVALEVESYIYEIHNRDFLTIEVIRKDPFNIGYLLGKLARLNLVNMDIFKLFDELKYFRIDFSENVLDDEIPIIKEYIRESFEPGRTVKIPSPNISDSCVTFDCNHSRNYAKMTLNTVDQRGLMSYLISMFDELGIDIATAKIHTFRNRVQDLFLIEKNGNFCHNIDTIIKKLSTKEE